jgi:hypothetical protein
MTVPSSTSQDELPKRRADVTQFLNGADPALVDEMLEDLPPSFFVVGAPRCGTTALSRALQGHPRISYSKPKETHYLLEDRSALPIKEIRRQYLQWFHPNLARDTEAIGDGSVSYLYRPDAIRRAMEFDPRARFIVSVRSPLNMLHSFHARLFYMLDEDVEDFGQAWALQDERLAGRHIPKRCRAPEMLQYRDVGMLGENVEKLFETAGRERCYVSVFDDFVADPGKSYKALLDFIGVSDDGRREFKQRRGNARFKYRWAQQIAMNPPAWAYRLLAISNQATIKRLKKLRKRVKSFNRAREQRQEMPAAIEAELKDFFRADIEKLSNLLGRDLTHWVKP